MHDSAAPILFLCTGNYYRSRFAELLFNALAEERGLPWRAESRGLALERGANNFGPIARSTVEALIARGITISDSVRFPIQLTTEDLQGAKRVVALKEAEHRPLLADRYSGWEDRVEYWHVHDIDFATVEETIDGIEREVIEMLEEMSASK